MPTAHNKDRVFCGFEVILSEPLLSVGELMIFHDFRNDSAPDVPVANATFVKQCI